MSSPKFYAVDYVILRDVKTGQTPYPVDRKPKRVVSLLDEEKFKQFNGLMTHNDTVFFEERFHDWSFTETEGGGLLRVYTRIRMEGDVVVVFEERRE